MNFAFTDEQAMIAETAKAFFAESATSERTRAAMAGEGLDRDLWRGFCQDLGLGGIALPDVEAFDYHTAAGMAIAHFGRIPNVGEYFDWDGWRIEVVDLDGPRVDKLLLQPLDRSADDA